MQAWLTWPARTNATLDFCQDHYRQRWLTISIHFGLAVWFCSGQELPAHPCSLAWMRAGRAAITPQNKTICWYPQHKDSKISSLNPLGSEVILGPLRCFDMPWYLCLFQLLIYIYIFSRRFYPKRLTVHSGYTCFITMCVPWESNPQPFALLTQCSTTEPQEPSHNSFFLKKYKHVHPSWSHNIVAKFVLNTKTNTCWSLVCYK